MANGVKPIKLPAQSQSPRDRIVATPFQFYLEGSENLRVIVWNSLAGVVVTVRARFVNAEGNLNWQEYKLAPTSDRLATSLDFPLGGGVLSNLIVFASSGTPVIGQTFCQVSVVVGTQAAAPIFATVVQGYVTSRQVLSYPGSIVQSSLDGGGYLRAIAGTAPPPGGNIAETVPAGARWELITLWSVFAADFGGAARSVSLLLSTSGVPFAVLPQVGSIAPLSGFLCQWSQGLPYSTVFPNNTLTSGLPAGVQLLAGGIIGTFANNESGTDTWTAPQYLVREWLEAQ